MRTTNISFLVTFYTFPWRDQVELDFFVEAFALHTLRTMARLA